jgi:hypothetical protein
VDRSLVFGRLRAIDENNGISRNKIISVGFRSDSMRHRTPHEKWILPPSSRTKHSPRWPWDSNATEKPFEYCLQLVAANIFLLRAPSRGVVFSFAVKCVVSRALPVQKFFKIYKSNIEKTFFVS